MVSRVILCLYLSTAHGFTITSTSTPPVGVPVVQAEASPNSEKFVIGTAALSKHPDPIHLLNEGYARGFRRLDIARTYGGGKSEEIVGSWIRQHHIDPQSLNIVTKGGMGDDKYGDPNRPILTQSQLRHEFQTSLDTLGVPSVNLYMYHRDDPRIGVADLVLWMNEFVSSSSSSSLPKAQRWGVSNWSFARFREATQYARDHGLVAPSANSPQLSLADPACEVWPTTYSLSSLFRDESSSSSSSSSSSLSAMDELQWYANHNVELLCWEVLAKGFMAVPDLWAEKENERDLSFLAGEDEDAYELGSDEWRLFRIQRAYCTAENYRRRRAAVALAESSGLTLAQIAMLYPLSLSSTQTNTNANTPQISVIAGVDRPQHFDDMAMLRDLKLSPKEMNDLLGRGEGGGHSHSSSHSSSSLSSSPDLLIPIVNPPPIAVEVVASSPDLGPLNTNTTDVPASPIAFQ